MEPIKLASAAMVWIENSSVFSPTNTSESPEWKLIAAVIPPFIFTLSVVGLLANSFVLLVFLIHKDRLTIPEIYLGNLALADLILLMFLPFWAVNIQNNFQWPYGDASCKIINSYFTVNYYTSVCMLAMISVDRYLALVKTMNAIWMRRARHAKIICGLLWLFGLLLSLPTMLHRKLHFFESEQLLACILDYEYDKGFSWKIAHKILMNVVGFFLPVLVIVFCSYNIIRVLNNRMEIVRPQDANDRKATALVYSVTLLFLLCWTPFQIITFLDILCDFHLLDEELWYHTLDVGHQFSVYVAFLNSVLNPLLYVISGQYFRRKVSAIYRRNRQNRRGSDMTIYQRSVISTYINKVEQINVLL